MNNFKVGDEVVCISGRRYKVYKFNGDKDHWLSLEKIRHATTDEIKKGYRNDKMQS